MPMSANAGRRMWLLCGARFRSSSSMFSLQVPAVLTEHPIHQQIAGSPGAFHSRLENKSEFRHELLRDLISLLDAGGYALHSQLLKRIEEHEPQKLRGNPSLPDPCNSGSYVAAVEVTIYNTSYQFVITFQPYRAEIVGFPAASDLFSNKGRNCRPIFRVANDAFHVLNSTRRECAG